MHLAYALRPYGHHPAARLHSTMGPKATTFEAMARQAVQAEEAGFDFVLIDDRSGGPRSEILPEDDSGLEPTTLIAALATKVERIGLIGSASTIEHAPYTLARRFASLDNGSDGRTGWNIGPASGDLDRDVEYVGLVKSLWDSWDDDAFIYDKKAARFFRPEKMHVLNHEGAHFSVRGPLNVNRSPQGRPVISTVLSPGSLEIAARFADVIIIRDSNLDTAQRTATAFCDQLVRAGRNRDEVRILLSVIAYLGQTTEAARDLQRSLDQRAADNTPAETVVGTVPDAAGRIVSILERLTVDGVELLPPVVSEEDVLLYDLASALRDRSGAPGAARGATLRHRLGLIRPDLPAIQKEDAR